MNVLRYLLILPLLFCSVAWSADYSESMKARLGDVLAAKDAGSVGEGVDGFLHLRDAGNEFARKLLEAENADRRLLFQDLASKTGGEVADVAQIGRAHV